GARRQSGVATTAFMGGAVAYWSLGILWGLGIGAWGISAGCALDRITGLLLGCAPVLVEAPSTNLQQLNEGALWNIENVCCGRDSWQFWRRASASPFAAASLRTGRMISVSRAQSLAPSAGQVLRASSSRY